MTQERRRTPRTARLAGRPVHVLAAAAVLVTASTIAVGQAFGLQATGPAPTVAATTVTPAAATGQTASAPAAQRGAGQRAVVQRVAATAVSTPSSSATPTPTSTDTVAPSPTAVATPTPAATGAESSTPAPVPSPAPTPSASSPATAPSPSASAPAPAAPAAPTAPVAMSPGLFGGTAALAVLGAPGAAPVYLPAGQPLADVLPFQTFRVLVQLGNGGPGNVAVAPRLEYRVAGTGDFLVVPEAAVPGTPLHAAEEWVKATGGTTTAPENTTTTPDEARLAAPDGAAQAEGHRLSGVQAAPQYTVLPGTVTEQEFTAAFSIDAPYGATYELRVTDGGAVISGAEPVSVTVADPPPTLQSPGQQQGSPSGSTPASTTTTTAGTPPGYRLVSQPSTTTTTVTVGNAAATAGAPAADLVTTMAAAFVPATTAKTMLTDAATVTPSYVVTVGPVGPNGPATIHDPYSSTTSGQCSVCHLAHTAKSGVLVKAPAITEQCYTCHADGGPAGAADVKAQYALGQPANDPTTRSYWSHDTADATSHTRDADNEFEGRLSRHSQCSDCHDPHGSTDTPPTMTATGWTAPGAVANVSGVAVTNGAAGTTPSYTWRDGTVAPVTAEYQLCFKCHSGFTTLPADVPGKPSQNATDLGVALNPANASFHPIEAPGRNQTQKLADSLAGSSPYKLWNFSTGDTVRCVSCHSSNTTGTSSNPAENAPDASNTAHASTNRGILTRPYENRVLSASGSFYDNKGSALCLTCHMETPFMNRQRPAAAEGTNFVFHGLHMSGISGRGSGGLDIDTPGAGQGNARCAECHFDSHGTTTRPTAQKLTGEGLVVFGPDVLASKSMGGLPSFTKTATSATCTLTCHGKDHQEARYTPDPPASIGNVPVGG
ncbi:MAG: cytochrome c3 family protein [Ornithinibacter sp.]